MTHSSRHEHKFTAKHNTSPYICDGCNQLGVYTRYECQGCNISLHKDCARAPADRYHPFFPGCLFLFRKSHFTESSNPSVNPGRYCNACGHDIEGYNYHYYRDGLDLHPCCMMLPAHLKIEGEEEEVELKLVWELTAKCSQCSKRKIENKKTWGYVSKCGGFNLHVSCVNDILLKYSKSSAVVHKEKRMVVAALPTKERGAVGGTSTSRPKSRDAVVRAARPKSRDVVARTVRSTDAVARTTRPKSRPRDAGARTARARSRDAVARTARSKSRKATARTARSKSREAVPRTARSKSRDALARTARAKSRDAVARTARLKPRDAMASTARLKSREAVATTARLKSRDAMASTARSKSRGAVARTARTRGAVVDMPRTEELPIVAKDNHGSSWWERWGSKMLLSVAKTAMSVIMSWLLGDPSGLVVTLISNFILS